MRPLAPYALLIAIGCGAPIDASEETDASTGAEVQDDALEWGPCPVGFETECAYLSVPIERDDADGVIVDVLLSRRPAASGVAATQLWLVQGGPGGSADVFSTSGTITALAGALPDVEIYTMEHRGVGESAALRCPEQKSADSPGGPSIVGDEVPACAAFIDEAAGGALHGFSTTEAARDLQAALDATREEGTPQIVYGLSYGSYLVLRFLQLFPDGVEAVVLDSVSVPGKSFADSDLQPDVVAEALARRCENEPVCGDRMGPDPWNTVVDVVAMLEAGHCEEAGLVGDVVPLAFSQLLADVELRETVFPLLYRLQRCDPDDVAAVRHFAAYVSSRGSELPPDLPSRFNPLLQVNVAVVEFWVDAPTPSVLLEACDDAVFCPGISRTFVPFLEGWPTYDEPFQGTWPSIDVPLLAMNGTLDQQTPISSASTIAAHLSGPSQTFVEVPSATHFIVNTTTVLDPGAPTCGVQMVADFVRDPQAPVSTSCLERIEPLDLAGTPEDAMRYFGTESVWD